MKNSKRIVIIGAGASGIAAATKLIKSGFNNVLILEAENRIGGRIYTVPFAENVIDVGAQWCHGQNVVYDLVKDENLLKTTGDIYETHQCIRSNKEVLSKQLSQRLKNIFNEYFDTKKEGLSNYKGSLGAYLIEKFNTILNRPENKDIDRTIAAEYLENCIKFENSMECSDDLFRVSGKGHLEYWNCEGDILLNWKDKGYGTLINILLNSNGTDFGILNKRILLNKRVKNINWNQNESQQIQIECEDGINVNADHVICSISLAVLKETHMSMFKPNLPQRNINAIEGLGIGTVDKIFIEFPEKFWPDDWQGFTLLWTDEDLKQIQDTENFWMKDMFGFYIVCDQPRVLSGWLIGASARYAETLPNEKVLNGCMYLLRRFLNWQIPEPVNFLFSAWYSNPNFRGSYSHRSTYTDELKTGASDLATTVENNHGDPVIQFAGEATHEHYYSTVHGAVESGWREAQKLIDFYSSKNNSQL